MTALWVHLIHEGDIEGKDTEKREMNEGVEGELSLSLEWDRWKCRKTKEVLWVVARNSHNDP